jgi:hypothetical protein
VLPTIEAVASSFLRCVKRNGLGGRWVWGKDAFDVAIEECAELDWVRQIREHPVKRKAVGRSGLRESSSG